MVICELCGKEFKNTQGLRGHMTFVHGKTGSSKILSAPAATEHRLSELEQLLGVTRQNTEQATEQLPSRLRERLGLTDSNTQPITEQLLEQHTRQLTELSKQVTQLSDMASNSEFTRLAEQVTDLADDLASIKKTISDIKYGEGKYTTLDDELAAVEFDREAFRQDGKLNGSMQQYFNEMAENAKQKWGQTITVNELEKRVTQLEQQLVRVPQQIKQAVNDQVSKEVLPAIERLINNFTDSLNAIQSRLKEHQLVIDWVVKKYDLKKVKK